MSDAETAMHMRRILIRAEKARAACLELRGVVSEAERHGMSREAITRALSELVGDWQGAYTALAETNDLLIAIRAPVSYDLVVLNELPLVKGPEMEKSAFDDGYFAHINGKPASDCPHGPGVNRKRWRNGWFKAEQDVAKGQARLRVSE